MMQGKKSFIVKVCMIPFCGFVLWIVVRVFIADQFVVNTPSMMPTLIPGDRVLVNKLIFGPRIYEDFNFAEDGQELKSFRIRGIRKLRHNDIVVFNFPINNRKISFKINHVYCKRCVAIPGDSICVRNGFYNNNNYKGALGDKDMQERLSHLDDRMTINREFFPYANYCDTSIDRYVKNVKPLYVPKCGDSISLTVSNAISYKKILEYETNKKVDIDRKDGNILFDGIPRKKHCFQHNYYFMAGDNVLNSKDSRYWGLVPEDYIIGVVSMVTYSINSKSGQLRKDRLLHPLYNHNCKKN